MQSPSEYNTHIENLIGMLAQAHALGRDIDITMCVTGLEPNRIENRKVRDFVIRTLKINSRDFDRALHLESVRAELGTLPRNSRAFVEAYADSKNITARYNGVLRINERPYIFMADGRKEFIPSHMWENYEFKTMIKTKFNRNIGFDEVQQALRVRAAELQLDFSAAMINDASEVWYADICRNRLWQIMAEIDFTDSRDIHEAGQASLRRLAETCFDCTEGADFVVAVLNKFIWQVKRKIEDMPIYDHLMPVILGKQGAGKSTLVRKLLDPVEELWVMTDFRQMTDNRNISLWRNFVIFLDEMGWASKADMDTVKNVITAPTLTRRVMRTNATQEVKQNVTFIGAANASEMAELIRDPSGIRRFVSITMRDCPDHGVINEIDWKTVWQSVNHAAEDPMAAFKPILLKRQESERIKTPVEDWIAHLAAKVIDLPGGNRRFRSSELHTAFREFEDQRFPGLLKTSLPAFVREMKRFAKMPASVFRCVEDDSYILWEWRGASNARYSG